MENQNIQPTGETPTQPISPPTPSQDNQQKPTKAMISSFLITDILTLGGFALLAILLFIFKGEAYYNTIPSIIIPLLLAFLYLRIWSVFICDKPSEFITSSIINILVAGTLIIGYLWIISAPGGLGLGALAYGVVFAQFFIPAILIGLALSFFIFLTTFIKKYHSPSIRPGSITALSVTGLFINGFFILFSLLFVYSTISTLTIADISILSMIELILFVLFTVASIGYIAMRKWAVYLYTASLVLYSGLFLNFITNSIKTYGIEALPINPFISPIIVIIFSSAMVITGFLNIKKMRGLF